MMSPNVVAVRQNLNPFVDHSRAPPGLGPRETRFQAPTSENHTRCFVPKARAKRPTVPSPASPPMSARHGHFCPK